MMSWWDSKDYKTEEVRENAAATFRAFQYIAMKEVKARWKSLTFGQRRDALRAVQFIGELAQNVEKNFSRDATNAKWVAEGYDYARKHNLPTVEPAFLIVHGPGSNAYNKAQPAVWNQLGNDFYNFCIAVQNFEYDSTSSQEWVRVNAPRYAASIARMRRNMEVRVDEMKTPLFLRPFVEFAHAFSR